MARIRAIALGAFLLTIGCGGDGDQADGTIVFSRSGGIAGISESMEIAEDGQSTLALGTDSKPVRFQIPSRQLDRITAQLNEADIGKLDTGTSSDCFDCFSYELEYSGESASADDSTATPAFHETIAPIERVIEANRPDGSGVKG